MFKRSPLPVALYLQFTVGGGAEDFYLRLSMCKYTTYNDYYLQSWL